MIGALDFNQIPLLYVHMSFRIALGCAYYFFDS